jgi:two-component system NtrC family sensor kinase
MKKAILQSESEHLGDSIQLLGQKGADTSLKVAIVGGGKACFDLLQILDKNRLSRLNMEILGVSDKDPDAPGLRYAKEQHLFTTTTLPDLFTLKGLNLIIELTGSTQAREEILKTKPPGVSFMDFRAARLLFDLVQTEMEKTALERERQRFEEKNKKETQVILDSLPYRIMVVNMDGVIVAVNQTFLKEFVITRDDVLGKRCHALRHALDIPCSEDKITCFQTDRLTDLKRKGLISNYQEYTDENGNTRYDVITITPIVDENGNVVQILEASRDVTDRIKLEEEVRKSNIFFQNVIQSTVDGIVVVDTKGNVLIFNEGMERLTGYASEEIMNRGHLSTFYDINTARENMKKMRSDRHGPPGKLNPTSMTITTKEGEELPITLSASIIIVGGKEIGSVGVFRDMREILKMRKDLEEAHLQLVQSEKIASVGRMAAGVAHEINNPLSGILIFAELLKESLEEFPKLGKDAQEIIDQTLRCKKIVAELLEFSRQSIGKVASFNLNELIHKSLNLLINQAIFQNIEVRINLAPDVPEMIGDVGQIQQVITNLVINAADAMEGKGSLDIDMAFDPKKNQFVITITDTGPGIPEELRDKIFDIFFTTKPVGKGTGLGLSISQNIISLHGGNILVDSPQGGGTRFMIELPLGFIESPEEEPLFS